MSANGLITGDQFRQCFETASSDVVDLRIVSAYVTVPAIRWLSIYREARCQLLCRLSVVDLLNGASDLEALKLAMTFGWEIFFDVNQHSKIYLLNEKFLFVGSTNLTSNGLGLNQHANYETMVQITPTEKDFLYIQTCFDRAIKIDHPLINKMEAFIQGSVVEQSSVIPTKWPEYIFPEIFVLKVSDFPLVPPGESCREYAESPELAFAVISDWTFTPEEIRFHIANSKAYGWLKSTLIEQERHQAWYGFLASKLHDDLADDPAPYRRDVKQLLSNLLFYCTCYMTHEISVEQPRYSQLVKYHPKE